MWGEDLWKHVEYAFVRTREFGDEFINYDEILEL